MPTPGAPTPPRRDQRTPPWSRCCEPASSANQDTGYHCHHGTRALPTMENHGQTGKAPMITDNAPVLLATTTCVPSSPQATRAHTPAQHQVGLPVVPYSCTSRAASGWERKGNGQQRILSTIQLQGHQMFLADCARCVSRPNGRRVQHVISGNDTQSCNTTSVQLKHVTPQVCNMNSKTR